MEIKFKDSYGHKRKGIKNYCEFCKKEFITRKDQPGKFCSRECSAKSRRNRIFINCDQCGKQVERAISQLARSKNGFYFCSRKCKDKAQKIGGIKGIMPPHYGTSIIVDYRKFFKEEELVCQRCGYNEFSCGVDIHHIDGNRDNNSKDNLIPLCACCHRSLHFDKWKLCNIKTTP